MAKKPKVSVAEAVAYKYILLEVWCVAKPNNSFGFVPIS